MQYELINPSDPYTFLAEDKEIATLVVFSLGTMYGAESQDGQEEVPLFLFGGAKEWYQNEFGRTPDEGLEAKKEAVANALLSFMYGYFEDRRRYEAALNAITEEDKREQFIAEWQDGRSSMNDIGTYAHKLEKKLMKDESKNDVKKYDET